MSEPQKNGVEFLPDGPGNIIFSMAGIGVVMVIHTDGRLERGPGLSDDEVSVAVFDCLSQSLPSWMSNLRERAEKAEAALLAVKQQQA